MGPEVAAGGLKTTRNASISRDGGRRRLPAGAVAAGGRRSHEPPQQSAARSKLPAIIPQVAYAAFVMKQIALIISKERETDYRQAQRRAAGGTGRTYFFVLLMLLPAQASVR